MSYRLKIICASNAVQAPQFSRGAKSGFSLAELLAVLTVTSILAAIAIPSFAKLVQGNRLLSESHALLGLLSLGRSEAAKHAKPVTVCKSADGATCSTTLEVNWSRGIMLFIDMNANRVIDTSDVIVRNESPFNAGNPISFSAGNSLSYYPNGTSSGGTFTIHSGSLQRKVIVSLAGRARVE